VTDALSLFLGIAFFAVSIFVVRSIITPNTKS